IRPSQRASWVSGFLLGLAFHLRMIEARKQPETSGWLVRLSPTGRWLLGIGEAPPAPPVFPQTLLVQPNLEIVAYRQGLTTSLIGKLSRFAAWKNLGAACTLQLEPNSVYRAMEAGMTLPGILQTLERHGSKAVPTAVIDSLRTWSDKRERLTIYPAATLFEFATADDLTTALSRGLPGIRITDRLALVTGESGVDFRHFRLIGTRDYGLPPEKCVEVDADGVTLSIDPTRSDLLVETELLRFAESTDTPGRDGRRQFRLTFASLASARESGLGVRGLEEWFSQRTGLMLPAAARLLLTASQMSGVDLRRRLVLHVASAEIADGLQQWPQTRSLIDERLGPTFLAVAEEHAEELRKRLQSLGMHIES
ncbi:MAG: helicase-associated domain-containing protein, partial [Planctomycetia bacterium]|nr:helicase-associated domain-containing protein [Planctomycetia bacterium]